MHLVNQIRRWQQLALSILLCLAICGYAIAQTSTSPANPPQATASSKKKSKHHTTGKRATKTSRGKKSSRKRGQQAIDSARARKIQEALIREHYMQGEPSGSWDSTTQAAMQRYQSDHGWQSKQTPDSRALIKLGLGPSNDHLLNPESAMTTTSATEPKAAVKPASPADNLPQQ
jgi:peptidoglycan hydrolase-like protein with peptidoglycan-binding domain